MTYPDYLDFDLEIVAEDGAYTARVLASPKGEAEARIALPFDDQGLENVVLKLSRTRSGVRRLGSPQQAVARDFGTALYDAVFTGEVGTCFRRCLDEADRQGKGLRLRLRLTEAPALSNVPWEYLYPTGLGYFLVLSRHTPLVRYLDLPREVTPLAIAAPLRVLLVVSAPSDLAQLDHDREVGNLRGALADLVQRGLVELDVLPEPSLGALRRALRTSTYHVLHFIGHGGFEETTADGVLAFEDSSGRSQRISGADLGTMLHDHTTLRLAVLNACEGARTSPQDPFSGVAQSLVRQGLPAVVAMQFEITDEAAITLSHEFYAALSDGYPVDAALAEGRKAVFGEDNDVEWGTPVLYLRARDGRIFDVTPTAVLPRVRDERRAAPAARAAPVAPVPVPPPPPPPPRPRWRRPAALVGVVAGVGLAGVLVVQAVSRDHDGGASKTGGPSPLASSSAPSHSASTGSLPPAFTATRGTAAVDGSLAPGEWDAAAPIDSAAVVAGRDTGLRARWRVMWDEGALYLLAEVDDATFSQTHEDDPSQLWRGDSVHLELGSDAAGLGAEGWLRPTDAHYLFGPTAGGDRVIPWVNPANAKGTAVVSGRSDRGIAAAMSRTSRTTYLVEAAIPWTSSKLGPPRDGLVLSVNLNASDADEAGQLVCMVSSNPERTAGNQPHPGQWQRMRLG